MSQTDLTEGMEFDFMQQAKLAATIWLVRNGLSSKVLKSEPRRTIYRYIIKDCSFTLNINSSLKGVRFTKLCHYIYLISTYNTWRGRNNNAVLSNDSLNIGLFISEG